MDLPDVAGIYFYFIPSLNEGYIGSTLNLRLRYNQHKTGSHLLKLKRYFHELEYMILEKLPNYSAVDIRLVEKSWIDYYKSKGMSLLNKADPSNGKWGLAVYQYDLSGNQINYYDSVASAVLALGASYTTLSKYLNDPSLAYKKTILIKEKDFTEAFLQRKTQRVLAKSN